MPRPPSQRCCVIAPQTPACSGFGRPGLDVAALLPTSMLPLPTTAIPFLNSHHNAQRLRKVACHAIESAAPALRFMFAQAAERLLHQRKVKKSHGVRTDWSSRATHGWRLSGEIKCEPSALLSPLSLFWPDLRGLARPVATCRVSAPSPAADRPLWPRRP